MLVDYLTELVLAAGALGMAAFGIVEGLKRTQRIGEAGFDALIALLGVAPLDALKTAYGRDVDALLRGQYRGSQENLAKILRQGMRIGLTPANADAIAAEFGVIDKEALKAAAAALAEGRDLDTAQRNALGRFELAVDARIDGGLALAQDRYARAAKNYASAIALFIALVVTSLMIRQGTGTAAILVPAGVIVGLVAVPLAPVAKDVASAIKAAAEALKGKSS